MTADSVTLLGLVRPLAVRITAGRALRVGARTAMAALGALLAVEVGNLVLPLAAVPVSTALTLAAAAGAILTVIAAFLQRVDVLTASRLLDVQMGLEERTSTGVEIALGHSPVTAMGRRVIADASARVAAVRGKDAFPLRLPRDAMVAVGLAVVLAVWTAWLHGLTVPGTPARRTTEVIRQEGRRLEQFAQALQSRARTNRAVQTRRFAGQMRELGVGLQDRRLDRAAALGRVNELGRQAEAIRREINERVRASRPAGPQNASLPENLFRRDTVQRQIRQLRELASRLDDASSSRQDLLNRLGQITQEGGGSQPADVGRQLQQAREQLERGDAPGAGQSLTQALRELEGLEGLLADEEGLRSAQQQMDQSRARIAGGTPSEQASPEAPQAGEASRQAPGPNRPEGEDTSQGSTPTPQGPNEGVTPGTGQGTEKLGAPTPRLEVQRTPERVKGAQGEGDVSASEVIGAGRPGTPRVGSSGSEPGLLRQVETYMERARIPARYRALIRAYFQRLAQLR